MTKRQYYDLALYSLLAHVDENVRDGVIQSFKKLVKDAESSKGVVRTLETCNEMLARQVKAHFHSKVDQVFKF